MNVLSPIITTWGDGGHAVDGGMLASNRGPTPKRAAQEMRRGLVFGTTKMGQGEDGGRVCLTFHNWTKAWSVGLGPDDSIREVPLPGASSTSASIWLPSCSSSSIRRVLCPRFRRVSGRPTACSGTSKGHPRSDGEAYPDSVG